jgi:dTDP-4-dehydrorhamnose reductase
VTRYLIAGAGGMLGHELRAALNGRDVTSLTRSELDITDRDSVLRALDGVDVVINAAAYTKVDDAESNESEARAINAVGAANLAEAAARNSAKFVQVSTDYVFRGDATAPYSESAARDPLSAYGRTKAEGELLALDANPGRTYIVRTAWLYGSHGSSFPKTMLRLARERDELSVVDDQLGQPTWAADVAAQIVLLLDANPPGTIYHATNSGVASWFTFAQTLFRLTGLDPDRVRPTDSSSFSRPAPRPAYSVLSHEAWRESALPELRNWEEALTAAVGDGAFE